jgi:hypothetical protein
LRYWRLLLRSFMTLSNKQANNNKGSREVELLLYNTEDITKRNCPVRLRLNVKTLKIVSVTVCRSSR